MTRTGGFLRDNIEAFAVAIAMALVIRHFCVEAFRIPTGSMMPTLLGDTGPDHRHRQGDRILVDKFAWLRRDPRRFEVAVFQYPLNRNKNFIKRIGGMPGEWLRIVDGDIWTSRDEGRTWKIQRKPAGVRDQLLFPYYPRPIDDPDAFARESSWVADEGWSVDEAEGRFAVHAGANAAGLDFARRVLPYDDVDNGISSTGVQVGDVRVSFDLAIQEPGQLIVQIVEHGERYRLVLGATESQIEFRSPNQRHALDIRLKSGDEREVSFANVDDMLIVAIDGDTIEFEFPEAEIPQPSGGADPRYDGDHWTDNSIRIEARNLGAVLTDLRIDRDVHYGVHDDPEVVWKIPDGYYFMMGDNTQHSKDSRLWKIAEAYGNDGRVLRWEPNPGDGTRNPPGGKPYGGPKTEVVVEADIDGHTRHFRAGEIKRWEQSRPWPWVSRDHLIGRAFAVFWPIYLPPVSSDPTRVKLIR